MKIPKFLCIGVCLIICFQILFFFGFHRRGSGIEVDEDYYVYQEKEHEFLNYMSNELLINDVLHTFRNDRTLLNSIIDRKKEIEKFLSGDVQIYDPSQNSNNNNNDNNNIVEEKEEVKSVRLQESSSLSTKKADGSNRYAFAFYATDNNYACGVKLLCYHLMKNSEHINFDIIVYVSNEHLLELFKTFHPRQFDAEYTGKFILKVVNDVPTPQGGLYKWTFIKTVPLKEIEYDRITIIDADTIGPLKDVTHLFNLPPFTFAAPVGYWENELCFTATLMSFKPSMEMYEKITGMAAPKKFRNTEQHVLNYYFRPRTRGDFYIIRDMVLLPLEYTTLTHSVRLSQKNNPEYVGDPLDAYARSYMVHFSDGGKPWSRSDREPYAGDVFNVWRKLAKDIC